MFDTSEDERTLDMNERIILQRQDGRAFEIKNAKALIANLGPEAARRAAPLRKSLKIRNNAEDYVRLLAAIYPE